jgi:hypothetical protein
MSGHDVPPDGCDPEYPVRKPQDEEQRVGKRDGAKDRDIRIPYRSLCLERVYGSNQPKSL